MRIEDRIRAVLFPGSWKDQLRIRIAPSDPIRFASNEYLVHWAKRQELSDIRGMLNRREIRIRLWGDRDLDLMGSLRELASIPLLGEVVFPASMHDARVVHGRFLRRQIPWDLYRIVWESAWE